MLESLVRYAERRGLGDDPCFEAKHVKWAIVLDTDGKFRGITPLGDPEDKRWKGKLFSKVPRTPNNELQSGGKSHFLAEAATTVLLLPDKKDKPPDKKYVAKHAYFKELVKEAASVGAASLKPVTIFLNRSADVNAAGKVMINRKRAKATDTVTFDVGGRCVLDRDDWHVFWQQKRGTSRSQGESQGYVMPCLATGILAPPLKSHGKVKRVWGSNPVGASLVANDKEAFQSYGLEQAHNAPVSAGAESRYREALQELIDRAIPLGGAQFVYWTRTETPSDPVALVQSGEQVGFNFFGGDENLLKGGLLLALRAVSKGDYTPQGYEGNTFYGCAISANGGRLVVRDWWESSLKDVLQHVAGWAEDLSIAQVGGGLLGLPKFGTLLYAMVSEERGDLKDIPPQIPVQLMGAALRGLPLPRSILGIALHRHVADLRKGKLSVPRVALMKAFLSRLRKESDPVMKSDLNFDEADRAYRCGRLLAVFEKIQRAALGELNVGVVQRFYGAASVTPALVMPRLFRLSKHHLSVLSGGLAGYFHKQIEEITRQDFMGTAFPKSLTLEEQGRFALGYYHQRAHRTNDSKDGSDQVSTGGSNNE